jgi:hypothetical protein
MFLEELFARIKNYGSRSIQLGAKEEGAAIKRRLQELLDLEKPIQAEMLSTESGTLHGVKNLFEGRDGSSSLTCSEKLNPPLSSADEVARLFPKSAQDHSVFESALEQVLKSASDPC